MAINLYRSRQYLQDFDFRSLFVEELGWSNPPNKPVSFEIEGKTFDRTGVAELAGVMILEIKASSGEIPEARLRIAIHKEICKLYLENLLIFVDDRRTQSLWYWVKRDGNKQYRRDHLYVRGQSGDLFLSKLGALVVDLKDWDTGNVSIISAARRLKDSFDIDRVTKKFFTEFQSLHGDFLEQILGIGNESDRRWYASVLLNRLMFTYFLQRKYFLDNGDELYLQNKLKAIKQEGSDCFYREFLQPLFFEGFGKPEVDRDDALKKRIGKIRYLNGGLFLSHTLEAKYTDIQISDRAFEQVLDLFSRYSWNLDDTPAGKDDEINPDVLGYIFEKYINQKEFGAYYTRPEITEYLCDRTINKLILEKVAIQDADNLNELLLRLDANLCDRLLNKILPELTLLDPACGSGAFLVAAMKTLIGIYATVVSQAKLFTDHPKIAQWLADADEHPSLDYYIKKRIITDNLYGVDIMQEATEIAKLRLFLALVASAKKVDELEPLPNIDFNIMAGNSLIGLIRVDAKGFDRLTPAPLSRSGKGAGGEGFSHDPTQGDLLGRTVLQGNLLQGLDASEYEQILEDKNKSIALYKKHAFQSDAQRSPDVRSQEQSILELRNHIDKLNRDSQAKLNELLLKEFSDNLSIKYEEVLLTGKSKKRVLNIADIEALEPFHWGYHFDAVFARGGFDAIITNPPWEIFKPQAKEFFALYSDLVTKNKMDIKAFEKEQKKLLESPEIAAAWCEYQSKFPYVSAYYRSAEDYKNQISVVNGKKAGTDINLYKLFVERCYNLMRKGGECGIVIPSGIYTDLGTKQLREMLFSETEITGLFCFENRKEIFEGVDSRFKFVILSFEKGSQTKSFATRFMRHDVAELANFPSPDDIRLDVPLIRKLSPDSLSIMEFKGAIDVQIAKKMLQFPLLGQWIKGEPLQFSREFMSTDDHPKFNGIRDGLIVYEGKMFEQFNSNLDKPQWWMSLHELQKTHFYERADWKHYRFAIRRIARNTDIRTLITTILPRNTVVVHSVFVNVKNIRPIDNSLYLVSLMNSFVLDFALRSKVSANVSQFFIHQLPVPRLQQSDKWFTQIVERAARLICTTPEFDDLAQEIGLKPLSPAQKYPDDEKSKYGAIDEIHRAKLRAELDGIIAHIYGLTEIEFAHILSTFPIVANPVKLNALNAYRDVRTGLIK